MPAQGFLFDIDPEKNYHNASISYTHPRLEDFRFGSFTIPFELDAFSGTYLINLNIKTSENNIFHVGIPYNYYKPQSAETSESGFGNIRFGLQMLLKSKQENKSAMQYFLNLGTADRKAATVQGLSEIGDLQNYVPDFHSLTIQYVSSGVWVNEINRNYYFGGSLLVPADKDHNMEVFLRFGFEPYITFSGFNFLVTFRSVFNLTTDIDKFSDRFLNRIGTGLSKNFGLFEPKFSYQIVLNEDVNDLLKGLFIFALNYNFGE